MKYQPALDSLRAIAVAAVLAFHSASPFAQGGFIGVDVFFVLSGYLITTILAAEYHESGRLQVLEFYRRRAIRLYPTLLLVLAGFLVAAPWVWPELPAFKYAIVAALYLTDYVRAFGGVQEVLSYTWSLAVEEHFYLIWPLVLPFVLRLKNPARALFAAYIVATIWRIANYGVLGWEPTYFRFDTRVSGILLGSALALGPRFPVPRFARPAALALLAVLVMVPNFHELGGMTTSMIGAEACTALLIMSTLQSSDKGWGLESPMLAYIGRLSYGIYMWHFPLMYWLRAHLGWDTTLIIGSVAAVALAALSYHLIDVPLKLRRRRRPVTAAFGSPLSVR